MSTAKSTLLLFLLISSLTMAQASTMFTLSGVKKVYPVVEIMGNDIPQQHKAMIMESINETLDELQIEHSGFDQRAFALLVKSMKIDNAILVNVELVLGEQVHRLDAKEKTFALTYQSQEHFLLHKGDDVEGKLEDALVTLLDKFSEQYKEENKAILTLKAGKRGFAEAAEYETDYETAMKKAKAAKKPVMLVLVSNFCPWCRKFESRVLLKEDVNKRIHEDYIPLVLNKERDTFPKKLDMAFTPIVHFIDYKTGESYKSVAGYNNKEEFLYILRSFHKAK